MFQNNFASTEGGAIVLDKSKAINIFNSIFKNNLACSSGGALHLAYSSSL